jgi:hypothetical protein
MVCAKLWSHASSSLSTVMNTSGKPATMTTQAPVASPLEAQTLVLATEVLMLAH